MLQTLRVLSKDVKVLETLRVEPELFKLTWAYVAKWDLNVRIAKYNADSHASFSGSTGTMVRVQAFIDGLKAMRANDDYNYYGVLRRHKKTGLWEEWSDEFNSWQYVWCEEFNDYGDINANS